MCGRYALHSHPDVVALLFGLSEVPAWRARYNIAPASQVLIVRQGGAALVKWGLVPHWAKDAASGAKLNNARAETAAAKPSFRDAFRKRRCLIPANGFFEWQRSASRKQPYYIHPAHGELFAFAGLWEAWRDLETCAILTTAANTVMHPIHDRMPVILGRPQFRDWLAGAQVPLGPCPDGWLLAHPVGRAVNYSRNDGPELIAAEVAPG
jgi:putative SOS response-associated peptidase YedK